MRSKNSTSSTKSNYGGRRYRVRVFTEQGVAMLATILKSKVAIEVSISIIDAFVAMRNYISSDLIEQRYINNIALEDHELIKENKKNIKLLKESLDKLSEKRKETEIFFADQNLDAYVAVIKIFNKAKKSLVIVDPYADVTLLDIVKRLNVNVIIITKPNNLLTKQDINKYNEQYHNLKVVFNNSFHDRFFILDDKDVYHCGASINKIGSKTFAINFIGEVSPRKAFINDTNEVIKRGGFENE